MSCRRAAAARRVSHFFKSALPPSKAVPVAAGIIVLVEMMGAEDTAHIAAGHAFSLSLNMGGIVHAWGRNNEGQLGIGMGLAVDMYAMESIPRPVKGELVGRRVSRIAAGHTHAAAVTEEGELFTWGM